MQLTRFVDMFRDAFGGEQRKLTAEAQSFDQFRKEVLQSVLQAGSENYKENVRIAGIIEDKAQKAGALAGVFLAASLAFVKPGITVGQVCGSLGFGLLLSSICLLLLCIGLCLSVLWVRPGRSILRLCDVRRMARDLLSLSVEEVTAHVKEGFCFDQAELWAEIVKDMEGRNQKKAILLKTAQAILALAMGCVGMFVFWILIEGYKAPKLLQL